MFAKRYLIPVMRGGEPLGSFRMKLYYTTSFSGRRSQTVPQIGHAQSTLVASERAGADRRVGDVLDLSGTPFAPLIGCALAKVIDPCPYAFSVQSALQRTPYQSLSWWTQATLDSQVLSGSFNVGDACYTAAGSVLAYLEPASSHDKVLDLGNADMRVARMYSTHAVSANDVVVDADGGCWIAQAATEHESVIDNYVTIMRYTSIAPAGVAI